MKERFTALDVLRGLIVAGMIIVNNPGDWGYVYRYLEHAEWLGLLPADLIFPGFLFCMGFAMYFSLGRFPALNGALSRKVVSRAGGLIAIGWAVRLAVGILAALRTGKGLGEAWLYSLEHLRFLGVFPRLGLCFLLGAVIIMLCRKRATVLVLVTGMLLVDYGMLLAIGNGYSFSAENVLYQVDHLIFTDQHLYTDTVAGVCLALDPEGLLSHLSCLGNVLLGYSAAAMALAVDGKQRGERLANFGIILLVFGIVASYWAPFSKKIWSPSFVLVTSGVSCLVLGWLCYLEHYTRGKNCLGFFSVLGENALFSYLFSTILSVGLAFLPLTGATGKAALRSLLGGLGISDLYVLSLLYAFVMLAFSWLASYVLHVRGWHIKL